MKNQNDNDIKKKKTSTRKKQNNSRNSQTTNKQVKGNSQNPKRTSRRAKDNPQNNKATASRRPNSNSGNSKTSNKKTNSRRTNKNIKSSKTDNNLNSDTDVLAASESKPILNIAYIIIGLFIVSLIYFTFFMTTKSEDVVNSPYNKRQDLLAEQIVRGSILSADGQTLAHTVTNSDGTESRVYPYGDLFTHVVGQFSKGRTGIENSENFRLLTSNSNGLRQIYMDLTGQKNLGDNVVTTLDYDLQKAAYDGLGSSKGAIVVMEPSSGKILAMVSKPTYDPNSIDSIWENVKDDNTNKPLLNRATSEAYPPGSIFKVVTALEFIRENPDYEDYTFECDGSHTGQTLGENGEPVTITCVRAHGSVNLEQSLSQSCNGSFAYIGENLNQAKFKETIASLSLDTYLPEDLNYNHPLTAIGQGDVKVSPMQMAKFTSAIANGGVAMKPYVTDYISNSEDSIVKKYTPEIEANYLETNEAAILTDYMAEVVNTGTATSLQSNLYTAAGKTGTAQNQIGSDDHSWFMGFANTDQPEIVVSIIVENAGYGSQHAVPIAKNIFDTYFQNK